MIEDRTTKRCATCGRFRLYRGSDGYCIVCGCDTLRSECSCGRAFDYPLAEPEGGGLHCPQCGRDWRGRKSDWPADSA